MQDLQVSPPLSSFNESPQIMNMDRIRKGGAVRRYHTRALVGEQTVASHSWGVAAIVLRLAEGMPWTTIGPLLKAALFHDVAEYDTGDIPATAKWRHKPLKAALDELELMVETDLGLSTAELGPLEIKLLKAADMLELLWFCLEQRRLGNTTLDEVWENGVNFLLRLAGSEDAAHSSGILEMLDELRDLRDQLFESEPSSR